MISKPISIGIAVVVFFAVVGISYAIFSNTYDPTTMKFRNQELFDQMMSQNPKMTAQWMEQGIIPEKEPIIPHPEKMTSAAPLPDAAIGPVIDFTKGYLV